MDKLQVSRTGVCAVESPLTKKLSALSEFVSDDMFVRAKIFETTSTLSENENGRLLNDGCAFFEKAGPRHLIFHEPSKTVAAIVTCGGICPGLNNVIRSAFLELTMNYGVSKVLGIRYGYAGMNPAAAEFSPPIILTLQFVKDIHEIGGTALGSSRGEQPAPVMVQFLKDNGINVLLCVGGDGTLRGAHALAEEVKRQGLPISVVGIPKTIDNDIPYVSRSFGYTSALDESVRVISAAHVEARGALNGIGVVKLMGRDAGFIAAGASLASGEVNFVLVPEVAFPLEGPTGFLEALKERVLARRHAVVVVAEGAGQHVCASKEEKKRDASGNVKASDIGVFLVDRIKAHFAAEKIAVTVKYIDPSYTIRSIPAGSSDKMLCDRMARTAVHAAMAGRTDTVVGLVHDSLVHVPICVVCAEKKRMRVDGDMWGSVVLNTGQPDWR